MSGSNAFDPRSDFNTANAPPPPPDLRDLSEALEALRPSRGRAATSATELPPPYQAGVPISESESLEEEWLGPYFVGATRAVGSALGRLSSEAVVNRLMRESGLDRPRRGAVVPRTGARGNVVDSSALSAQGTRRVGAPGQGRAGRIEQSGWEEFNPAADPAAFIAHGSDSVASATEIPSDISKHSSRLAESEESASKAVVAPGTLSSAFAAAVRQHQGTHGSQGTTMHRSLPGTVGYFQPGFEPRGPMSVVEGAVAVATFGRCML